MRGIYPTSNVRVICTHPKPLVYRFPLDPATRTPHLVQVCPDCGEQVYP